MIGQKGMPAIHGGVERHVHELSLRLVKLGHEVTVYARKWYTGKNKNFSFDDVLIKHLSTLKSKHFDAISHTFLSTLDAIKNDYDVIHYHGIGPSLLSWIPRVFAPQIKVVTTFHSMDRKHEKWGLLARIILRLGEWTACRFAHETISVSRTIQQYCRDVYDTTTKFIPNGVPSYDKSQNTDQLEKWNLIPQSYLVMISRLIPHKGAHYLISAYKKLKQENPEIIGNKKLVIVGDGYYTNEYTKKIKAMVKNDNNIIFTGFQSGEALRQLFSHAYLMIHPSDNEGLPINVLEGMSYGLPILLSDIPEHKELTQKEDYLFRFGNVDSLIQKIKELLTKENDELQKQGKQNKEMVTKYYNWENITSNISELYKQEIKASKEIVPAIN